MIKKSHLFSSVATILILTSSAAFAAPGDPASTFSIAKKTQIPGAVLKPGTYSIQILDHLTDRMVIRVQNAAGKDRDVFLAIPSPAASTAGPSGALSWKSNANGVTALRGFAFPSGYTVEFVYPKEEAATLAKANGDRVIAIDPQSEGRPVLQKMSPDDMQMVYLWTLSLTSTGPNNTVAAIQAERYQGRTADSVETASAPPSRAVLSSGSTSDSRTEVATLTKPKVLSKPAVSPASPRTRPAIAALPHTASSLPFVVLVGLLSLLGAAAIRLHLLLGRPSDAKTV